MGREFRRGAPSPRPTPPRRRKARRDARRQARAREPPPSAASERESAARQPIVSCGGRRRSMSAAGSEGSSKTSAAALTLPLRHADAPLAETPERRALGRKPLLASVCESAGATTRRELRRPHGAQHAATVAARQHSSAAPAHCSLRRRKAGAVTQRAVGFYVGS